MKKQTGIVAVLLIAAVLIGGVFGWSLAFQTGVAIGNYSNEMKMDYRTNYADGGANGVERMGDHQNSPYFYDVDFYNAKTGEGLSILSQFKTIQQTSWWSCGVSCTEMVLEHFGKRGDWNEESLAALREDHEAQHIGTCLDQVIDMFEAVGGFELTTTYDYADNLDAITMSFVREQIAAGHPILVGWNDWGGHWQIIIGYDTMGTDYEGDDVIIVADPFDTTDHNQDGYGVYGAERFIYNFTFYDFFGDAPDHARDKCFVVVSPVQG
ncbi:MAG: C39 family peptidase [Peptococcaceae bacterium]|nr:C39 family peptidase [Peptococcaceae bacterium]